MSKFFNLTTDNEVISTFLNLKNSSSQDVNNLQIKPVKYVIEVIAPLLTYILNIALSNEEFPKEMQRPNLAVLPKGGDANNLANYRPISTVPMFS